MAEVRLGKADSVDLGVPVLEGGPLLRATQNDLILYLAIAEDAFQGDELPLLESLNEGREIPPGMDAVHSVRTSRRSR